MAALSQGTDGNFYGSTYYGGADGVGTVFRITADGTLTTLASFSLAGGGRYPNASLVQLKDGNFYGTTVLGGADGAGTIFRITPDGTLTTVAEFNHDNGAAPYSALTPAGDGSFYGTTLNGGIGLGSIFRLTLN